MSEFPPYPEPATATWLPGLPDARPPGARPPGARPPVAQPGRQQCPAGAMPVVPHAPTAPVRDGGDVGARRQSSALAIVSIGAGIPITAITGSLVHPAILGVGISWAGLVAINAVHVVGPRLRRRP